MNPIVVDHGDVELDASLIGAGLRIAPALVQTFLREGRISSRLERGVDDDAGKYRLTFVHGRRQFRLVIDEAGRIASSARATRGA